MSFFLVLGSSIVGFALYTYGQGVRQEEGKPNGENTHTNFQSPAQTMNIRDGSTCTHTHRYDPIPSYSKTTGMTRGVIAPAWACHTETGATVITYTKPTVGGYLGGAT